VPAPRSDALVFFGATGDLAYKKVFPALQSLVAQGLLDGPIVGVSRGGWTLERLRERARESVEANGGADPVAFPRLAAQLRYVEGDYGAPETFAALRRELGDSQRPLHYMAIPQDMFEVVVLGIAESGCARGARLVLEKPFGRDLASARRLSEVLHRQFQERDVFRIDHYLGKEAVQNLVYFRFANSFLEPIWNRRYVESVQITFAERIGIEGRGAFYDRAGAIRDVVQNHVLQVISNVAMEPPPGSHDTETLRDEKVKVLKAMAPPDPARVVRGQYVGYLEEKGVQRGSTTETFAAMELAVNTWRWEGVPFYLRAGKRLAQNRTEVLARLRRPPRVTGVSFAPNLVRFRLGPEFVIGLAANVREPGGAPHELELIAAHDHDGADTNPYTELLGDALRGETYRFARQDYVEEAWRIVDPVVADDGRPAAYEPDSWGPETAEGLVPGGWVEPPPFPNGGGDAR